MASGRLRRGRVGSAARAAGQSNSAIAAKSPGSTFSRAASVTDMVIPAARLPALKAREVRGLLAKIGYEEKRRRGSHRMLAAPNRLPIVFAFHDGVEVPPQALRHMLTNRAGLTDQEIQDLL